jgi:hypothetical protein
MKDSFLEYFKCPEQYVHHGLTGPLSASEGFFSFGPDKVCYGRSCQRDVTPSGGFHNVLNEVKLSQGEVLLPFDIDDVVKNLRCELYPSSARNEKSTAQAILAAVYYSVRPLLSVDVRKYLQRVHLRGWDQISFPHWPVDRSVDDLFELLMLFTLRSQKAERIPFIWFWPLGAPSSAIMTHDVETTLGRDFCGTLMDINDAYGVKASFQVVPEKRYEVTPAFLDSLRKRGFEIAVQDLNHDGRLYKNREQFVERVAKINDYRRQWGAEGFRAAVLYRNQDWFKDLDFSYDMSVPNVAHLDPQRGGCCTVMPYFVGDLLEIPVTTTQDYTLFHILKDYEANIWKTQIELIMEKHGLLSFIIHPDYVTTDRERKVYENLLSHLAGLRRDQGVWIATPGEVNRWWRQRTAMKIVEDHDGVRIEGEGSERACIAYASAVDGHLGLSIEPSVFRRQV